MAYSERRIPGAALIAEFPDDEGNDIALYYARRIPLIIDRLQAEFGEVGVGITEPRSHGFAVYVNERSYSEHRFDSAFNSNVLTKAVRTLVREWRRNPPDIDSIYAALETGDLEGRLTEEVERRPDL